MTHPHLHPLRRLLGSLAVLCAAVALCPARLPAAGTGDFSSMMPKADGSTALFGSMMPTLDRNSDIQVRANHMGADRENNRVTLDEEVVIRFSDITVRCDRATYDATTGDIHAEGNVSIRSTSGGSWSGERLDFNHRTGEGLIGAGVIRQGTFAVKAGEDVVRDEEGIFHAHDATVTTCSNDVDHWHWSATGDARYKDREFIEMRNAIIRLYGFPFLWAPYYYRDLNTNYGWRFMPGYTDKWGADRRAVADGPSAGRGGRGVRQTLALVRRRRCARCRRGRGCARGLRRSRRRRPAWNRRNRYCRRRSR